MLLAADGVEAVGRFLDDRGWRPDSVRPVQAIYRPTSSMLVRFRATAHDPTGVARTLNVCLETRAEPRAWKPPADEVAGRYRLPDPIADQSPWLAWAFPCDPAMPHLADAAWGPAVRRALAQGDGPRPLRVSVSPVRYRPRRRAVFSYQVFYRKPAPTRQLYAKALRTVPARQMRTIAAQLGPGTDWDGRTPSGVRLSLPVGQLHRNTLLFEPMAGTPLGRLLTQGGSLPHPARVAALLEDLRPLAGRVADVTASRHATDPVATAESAATLLGAVVPGCTSNLAAVVEAVRAGAAIDGPPHQVVHGDLYEGQVFVADDFSLGLIDLEELGFGDPALDAANFTAHLLAFALVAPPARERMLAYRELLRDAFRTTLDVSPQMLAWREALVMLQLATGPFRTLAPDWPARVARSVRVAARLAAASR